MKYTRVYENNELVAYESEKGRIELNYYDVTASGYFHKDYIIPALRKIGKPCRFSTLKEAKKALERV